MTEESGEAQDTDLTCLRMARQTGEGGRKDLGRVEIHHRTVSCQDSANRDQPGKDLERVWQKAGVQTTKRK